MTPQEQVDRWVEGESIHDDDDDQCCPDFSCCVPKLLAPRAVREAFKDANDQQRLIYLVAFMAARLSDRFGGWEQAIDHVLGPPSKTVH